MANSKACAACKYQRRKCNQTCELAAYFPASRFVEFVNAQHMFGMSNIEKIIATVEPEQRPAAAETILFEGNIWRNNPSVGCLGVTRFVLERVDFYEKELEFPRITAEMKKYEERCGEEKKEMRYRRGER
ncbi:LOB domain-containing protein 22-like [Pyrus x bretschneideri]|uniref:LOB domain-containing protein 22-like n=1 Tax=Pyrus x bretschneideri TaxID=225117 RepID=UPI00202E9301|nr:LOB domain-containing protein 22-like [Pyrus x bretschneideri]